MKSMTGMGRIQGIVQETPLRLEVKSVNHRFCEVSVRMPGRLSVLEIPAQQLIKSLITRGKLDVFISEERSPHISMVEAEAFKAYYQYLNNIKEILHLSEGVTLQHLMGGVSGWVQREINAEKAWQELDPLLRRLIIDFDRMRASEGARLHEEISGRFAVVGAIRDKISQCVGKVAAELEHKLKGRLAERIADLAQLDMQRLQTEVIFYLDRMDVSEEIGRLESHLRQAGIFLAANEPVGRKLDFLLQEINREFNTIASKSQSADIAHLVVDAKSELEKIREQIQNIE